ncbi:MAG TPA: alpha/beta hydrolase [Candidatus Sulfotelmatobacter sp.]|nr:alpha/beta hydrolase [Candidatus Sulfotelmatobacter sp.]
MLIIVACILLLQIALQLLCLWLDGLKFRAPGTLLHLPGRVVHVHQLGSGSPAVVLEAGIAASSLSWSVLQPQLAAVSTTFSYDRAGLGWSTSTVKPCNLSGMAEELHEWIDALRVPRPYILVGHSYAAYILRVYACRFPDELAGIILVDPLTPEEWFKPRRWQRSRVWRAVWLSRAGAALSALGVLRFCLWLLQRGNKAVPRRVLGSFGPAARETVERILGELAKLPQETVRLIRERWGHPKFFLTMARYIQTLPVCAAEVAGCDVPRNIPVTVISGAHQPPVRMAEHRAITAHSSRGRHIVADKSAHWVHLDQPELIVEACQEMMAGIKDGGRLHFPMNAASD